ncbi:MAG: NfeD family protein [Thermoguttaceae bacterium]|nr:NfeD family protein [Thermoguttaceae bacterium]MBQ6616752.1 NfeD family protein [Thermoguttaceae bacterium]
MTMLHSLYLICAVVGGLIMVIQFLMMILGFGDFNDVDVPDDAPDVDLDGGDVDAGDTDVSGANMISLARFLSFRVIVAASAFFGVLGLWADSARFHPMVSLAIALLGGWIAGAAVAFVMGFINKLQSSGNVKLESAVGKTATVYIPIPEHKTNTGKIQLSIQGRIDEMEAMTPGPALPSGAAVVIKEIVDGRIAIVEKE